MAERHADIVIVGAGIAGLWSFHHLKRMGYEVLLLENNAIGSGQTLASQGIIHSGLKYAFAGQINKLARSISAMPDLWRAALNGEEFVDLRQARVNASSQYLLIPKGGMGGLVKLVTKKALGRHVKDIPQEKWSPSLIESGFEGSAVFMGEPVLDIPSVIKALGSPFEDAIRKIDPSKDVIQFLKDHDISAKKVIFTAAESNHSIATQNGEDKGLKTQTRPLLMGLLKPAPFELYAHLVGTSDKPVATITTHRCADGTLCWYVGGAVAERDKDADPDQVYNAMKTAFQKYLPQVDFQAMHWATLPIDRIEGHSTTDKHLPDTPTIHEVGNSLYCWPTKLTFAPLLAAEIIKKLDRDKITPPADKMPVDWSFLPAAPYGTPPWEDAKWS